MVVAEAVAVHVDVAGNFFRRLHHYAFRREEGKGGRLDRYPQIGIVVQHEWIDLLHQTASAERKSSNATYGCTSR